MPKRPKELSALEVSRLAKRPGFWSVGGVAGLYLRVKDSLAASWMLRVVIGEQRSDLGLGSYPEVSLARARERAVEAREQIRKGIDPRAERKAAQAALRAAQARSLTFDEAAKAVHEMRALEFSNAKHVDDWLSSLTRYASPVIGSLPVGDIELAQVVSVLKPIWTTKTETATRVRQRMEVVFSWATTSGYRPSEKGNPAQWKGVLEHVLARPGKVRRKNHHPALPWQRMGEFMADLRGRAGMGARALEFAVLTVARSSEVRFATWDEIDLEAKLWRCPPEHMKGRMLHTVPLSAPAVAILEALPRFQGVDYVFSAVRGGPLSDMTIAAVIKRMHEDSVEAGGPGYLDPKLGKIATPHGTARSSFKDWCRTSTSYADEVSELALAHVNSDSTRAAYARDELLQKRTRLMRDWAKFCATVPRNASVRDIRERR